MEREIIKELSGLMKKNLYAFILCICLFSVGLMSCGKGKNNDESNTSAAPNSVSVSVSEEANSDNRQTVDSIIKEAENTHFSSDGLDDTDLYAEVDSPFTDNNLYIQKHLLSEFPHYEKDKIYFSSTGDDFFIGCFDGYRTLLYTYDSMGEVSDIKGRVVYKTEEELLIENADKNLKEDEYNDDGYVYHDNVLYYTMSEEDIFRMESSVYKYDLLKIAASGVWDKPEYLFFFSMPYKDGFGEKNYGEKELSNATRDLSEDQVYALFTNIMSPYKYTREEYGKLFSDGVTGEQIDTCYNTKYRTAMEFSNYDVAIAVCENGLAYASLVFYTVPTDYSENSIDNYMFATLLEYDEIDRGWKVANIDEKWSLIENSYYSNVLTPGCYEEAVSGSLFRRFWIQFNLNNPFYFEGIFTSRVMEIYTSNDGMYVTLYFYNDTDEGKSVSRLNELSINCDRGMLTSVSADLNLWIDAHDYVYDTLFIPADYLAYTQFSNVSVGVFETE